MELFKPVLRDIVQFIKEETGHSIAMEDLMLSPTRKEFEGDYTLLVFPLTRSFRKKPEEIAYSIGAHLMATNKFVSAYNVIKGFLNLSFSNAYWNWVLTEINQDNDYGKSSANPGKVMVEFSSPNTNKPLHLGHIRNILLGWSVSAILDAAGYEVVRTQIVNDRGIAVCKSMLAWQKFGAGETPETSGIKGDHLVGKYYVEFDKRFKGEYEAWQQKEEAKTIFNTRAEGKTEEAFFAGYKNEYFNRHSILGREARDLLLKWEEKEADTLALWKKMNEWVYDGFADTYHNLGVFFDSNYYESDTYFKGKEIVKEGLNKGIFYEENDGSIWVDLSDVGMDKKILLRSDGTALYITQDMGTAEQRYEDHEATKMVYVVGDEQDYHFKVLFEIMKRMERPYADGLFHLSYGMVDLPDGKMKSREGTVVDADDLMRETISVARDAAGQRAELLGKEVEASDEDIRRIAMAALKFFIIKINPQKRMVFNPEESVDMQGQTGPYVQNAYVRIQSIFRKLDETVDFSALEDYNNLNAFEKQLLSSLMEYPAMVRQAADEYQPSVIANYAYDLAKKLHKFYAEVRILGIEDERAKYFRLKLMKNVAKILQSAMHLLGIEMVDRM